ncbi:MAG TPA: hypothetical protein VFA27_00415 [Vicinamibacterales bacterium]|nr:hypothetical protein [Vicinamibacterales bacterium]
MIRQILAWILAATVLASAQTPPRRFLLYLIPPAEGFNLRRDVLTRALLLTEDLGAGWTLVLPPFGPRFFGGTTTIAAAARDCRFMLAPYAALAPALTAMSASSVLVDGLQIGYWDGTYGGARYWALRERMQFAAPLVREADRFVASAFGGAPYLAVHLRRGDFLATNRPHPSLDDVVAQVRAAQRRTGLTRLFVATDASDADVAYLRARLTFTRYSPPAGLAMSDGGVAILDQIVATRAAHFIGTEGSTFTRVIMEDREIAGRDPASTYDVLCKGDEKCPPSARFPRPTPAE